MTKPKTQAQLDRATDLRLLKTYGRNLAWYNEQFEKQNRGCAVCGDGPGTRRLHVDHDHKWKQIKIKSVRSNGGWCADAWYCGHHYSSCWIKKADAVRDVREDLKRESVRGLLCHRCNRAMILLRDNPGLLRIAAGYLEDFQNPLTGQE